MGETYVRRDGATIEATLASRAAWTLARALTRSSERLQVTSRALNQWGARHARVIKR